MKTKSTSFKLVCIGICTIVISMLFLVYQFVLLDLNMPQSFDRSREMSSVAKLDPVSSIGKAQRSSIATDDAFQFAALGQNTQIVRTGFPNAKNLDNQGFPTGISGEVKIRVDEENSLPLEGRIARTILVEISEADGIQATPIETLVVDDSGQFATLDLASGIYDVSIFQIDIEGKKLLGSQLADISSGNIMPIVFYLDMTSMVMLNSNKDNVAQSPDEIKLKAIGKNRTFLPFVGNTKNDLNNIESIDNTKDSSNNIESTVREQLKAASIAPCPSTIPCAQGMPFTVASGGLPGAVTMMTPTGNTASTTPTYTWNEEPTATTYYVVIYDLSPWTLVHNVYYDASTVCGGGTCSITPSGLTLTSGSHRWYVRPINDAGNGPDAFLNFNVVGGDSPPGMVTMRAPTGNTASTTPTYVWDEEPTATTYYVVIYDTSTWALLHNVYYNASAVCNGGTCSVIPSGLTLTSGSHRWYIRPTNDAGNGPDTFLNFSVSTGPSSPPGAVTMRAPSGTVSTSTPTYTWDEESTATSYYVVVYDTSTWTLRHNVYYDASTVCNGGTCSIVPSGLTLAPGPHRWYIRPINGAGNGPDTFLNFTIN